MNSTSAELRPQVVEALLMLPKLGHLDNDLVIIIIQYIYCVVHMAYIPLSYLGAFFFSRYPSVALARNSTVSYTHLTLPTILLV